MVNKSVLCNCGIEAENNFLLESLATCHDANANLIMYYTVNFAFTNHLDQFNFAEDLEVPILTNKMTSKQTLPIFLNKSEFDNLLMSSQTLKEYLSRYKCHKEISDFKERHDTYELDLGTPNKNFFTYNLIMDLFVFKAAIVAIITTMIILYVLCKHNKLRTLVVSLALQEVKEVSAMTTEQNNNSCNWTSQFYIMLALSIAIIGLIILIIFAILQVKSIKLCKGQLFLNAVKIILFISDVRYYMPIKLSKTAGSIHLFKITEILMPDKVKLNKHYIWDILEVDWKKVK